MKPDFDGDGFSDYAEFVAGTMLTNQIPATPPVNMELVEPSGANNEFFVIEVE